MLYDKRWDKQITKADPVLKILTTARGLIASPEKWCRQYSNKDGAICAVHALQRAWSSLDLEPDTEVEAYRLLGTAIGIAKPDHGPAIGEWNDAPERTHAEVLAVFDKAIEPLR